ncbi:MAG: hypothetical protein MUC90_07470 [Thermoplasmata archaeon]|nr:hypothetical protein [Thermoplasmata archaeon]
MSGRLARRNEGQLALMDAMVFFAAAILLSSIVMSFSINSPGTVAGRSVQIDANEILVAFLQASVSQTFEVALEEPLTVTGKETFAFCLSVEAGVLIEGGTIEPFLSMNEVIHDTLVRLSPHGFDPCVIVTNESRGLDQPLFGIPRVMGRSSEVYAGSAWIPSSTGDEILVVLTLVPASPAEVPGV